VKGDQPTDRWCGHVWSPGTVEGRTQVREMRVMAFGVEPGVARPVLLLTGTSAHGSTVPTALGDLDDRR